MIITWSEIKNRDEVIPLLDRIIQEKTKEQYSLDQILSVLEESFIFTPAGSSCTIRFSQEGKIKKVTGIIFFENYKIQSVDEAELKIILCGSKQIMLDAPHSVVVKVEWASVILMANGEIVCEPSPLLWDLTVTGIEIVEFAI